MTAHRSGFVLYKAQGQNVPDLIMTAMAPCPSDQEGQDYADFLDRRQLFFREQGREIATALRASLPQGTIDALLIELLQAKASVLVVRG